MRRGRAAVFLASIALLAWAVRSLGFEHSLVGAGEVVFWPGDPAYYARLALYSLENFPSVLTFDRYLNFPYGAAVPVPPLFAFSLASVTRALHGDGSTLEHVMAWTPPALGALTTLAVFAAARCLAGRGLALGAATLYALLGVAVAGAAVGNADHHALVGLLAALLLALHLRALLPAPGRGAWLLLAAGLGLLRTALALSWAGSLLYLGVGSATLLVAATQLGRRDLLALEAASSASAALATAPVVALLVPPAGREFSATLLSWLHVAALAGAAALAAALWLAEGLRAGGSPRARWLRLVAAGGVAAAGAALLVPGLAPALERAFTYLGARNEFGRYTAEQQPLFRIVGPASRSLAVRQFGWLAFAVPLAPLAGLLSWRDPGRRAAGVALTGWSALLAGLTVVQQRYGIDFAPAASVCFALGLGSVLRRLRSALALSERGAAALALALGGALLWPCLSLAHAPRLRGSLAYLGGAAGAADLALATPAGSLERFLVEVRRLTPETAGFLDADATPEYGVLASGNLGHAIRYEARRPTSVDGFWEYLDPEHFARAAPFFELPDEAQALALAAELRARYVLTADEPGIGRDTLLHRLHRADGLASAGHVRLEHFRLITEGPQGGRPLSDAFGIPRPADVIPYKLFEVVEGAVLEVQTGPGARVQADLTLRTPLRRMLVHRAQGSADSEGRAQLRVPYATQTDAPVRPLGPYRVRSGDREARVEVSEQEVRSGGLVQVELAR